LVKWSEEAQSFFQSAPDESVVLDVVISPACLSQTGEGFKELINSLNSNEIRRKLKKVIITDTSYLQRYFSPSQFIDPNVSSVWFLNNKDSIAELAVEVVVNFWINQIGSEDFNCWYKKIMTDFAGDENGNNISLEFRDTLNIEATASRCKGNGSFEACKDFLLEEATHACTFFNSAVVVYPMNLADSLLCATKLHGVDIRHLKYKISKNGQLLDRNKIDREVSSFMRETVSNVNFFVIDKYGNYIYKNIAFSNIVGRINAGDLDQKSWKVSQEVMNEREQKIIEEEYKGTFYLSIKAPLVINDSVEGVIGLAIDITDRKKAQDLEIKNKIYESQRVLAERVAHDVTSPLIVLKRIAENCKHLSEKEHIALRNSVMSIESMAEDLLRKYV
jgi:hypothetical protein